MPEPQELDVVLCRGTIIRRGTREYLVEFVNCDGRGDCAYVPARDVLAEVADETVERVAEWFAGMRDDEEPTDTDREYAKSVLAAALSTKE